MLTQDKIQIYIRSSNWTMIVFLSETNLKSGLSIYDKNKQENFISIKLCTKLLAVII